MAGTSPRIDTIEGLSNIAASIAQSQGLTSLADASSSNTISVPNTTIINRAPIINLANDVGTRFGISRVMTQQIYLIQTESGPSGQPVYGVANDFANAIRFVGADWLSNIAPSEGPHVDASQAFLNDFIEVSFYGIALNMLMDFHNTGFDLRISVDGGAEGANVVPSTTHNILAGRNYSTNQIINLVSGLSLGLHTVKIRISQSSLSQRVYGFEMIHQSGTSSNIIVNPGNIYGISRKGTLSSQQLLAYNSGFETGSLGTTGGRVLTYLKSDNTIGRAVTPAAASPSYLGNTNHASEELIRQIHFREFGAGRSDDFSTLVNSGSNRYFVMDDGTTTLAGTTVRVASGTLDAFSAQAGTGNGFSITFVGTGLDLLAKNDFDSSTRSVTVSVDDGASFGTLSVSGNSSANYPSIYTVVSGLSYGTHNVSFTNTSGSTDTFQVVGFRIYQPVTPSLPSGAIELARYNIMANFSSSNVTDITQSHINQLSQGTLFKAFSREAVFNGTGWVNGGAINYLYAAGTYWQTNANNDSVTYTFWGTGVVLRLMANGASYTFSTKLDGTLTSGTVLTGATNNGGGNYTSDALNSKPMTIQFTGLALGLHTVTFTNTQGTTNVWIHGIEVITPVHAYKSNLPGDFQNTLVVGSQGVSDSRAISPSVKAKASAQALGAISVPTITTTSFVPVPDMSAVITLAQPGRVEVNYSMRVTNNTSAFYTTTTIFINGAAASQTNSAKREPTGGNVEGTNSGTMIVPLPAGTHKFDLYWRADNGGTSASNGQDRVLTLKEL